MQTGRHIGLQYKAALFNLYSRSPHSSVKCSKGFFRVAPGSYLLFSPLAPSPRPPSLIDFHTKARSTHTFVQYGGHYILRLAYVHFQNNQYLSVVNRVIAEDVILLVVPYLRPKEFLALCSVNVSSKLPLLLEKPTANPM
jgi:hypothetical protein